MRRCISQRLEVTEATEGEVGLPRVVRLARRYKFSECETSVLYFTVVDQAGLFYDGSGRIGFGGIGGGTGGMSVCVCCVLCVCVCCVCVCVCVCARVHVCVLDAGLEKCVCMHTCVYISVCID